MLHIAHRSSVKKQIESAATITQQNPNNQKRTEEGKYNTRATQVKNKACPVNQSLSYCTLHSLY